MDQRNMFNGVSIKRFVTFAKEVFQKEGATITCSWSWLQCFLSRHSLSYRRRSTNIIVDPDIVKTAQSNFFELLYKTVGNNLDFVIFANMDETRFEADMPSSRTINKTGEKSVLIKTNNSDNVSYSVILAVLSNGFKFTPLLILPGKGTYLMKKLNPPDGINIIFSGKENSSFSNKEIFSYWLKNIYLNEVPLELRNNKPLLLLDNSGTHKPLKDYTTTIPHLFLPENSTGTLQPIDISVNGPFKRKIRHYWEDWNSTNFTTTYSGYYRKPNRDVIMTWVSDSWKSITKNTIENGFNAIKRRLQDEFEEESIDEDYLLNSESEEDNEVPMDLDEY